MKALKRRVSRAILRGSVTGGAFCLVGVSLGVGSIFGLVRDAYAAGWNCTTCPSAYSCRVGQQACLQQYDGCAYNVNGTCHQNGQLCSRVYWWTAATGIFGCFVPGTDCFPGSGCV